VGLNGDLALSVIAEETAERLRRMASSYGREYPRKAGLLRLASTLLDLLASELASGKPTYATLERIRSVERLLRWSGLPWQHVERIRRLAYRRLEASLMAGLDYAQVHGGWGLVAH